MVVVSVLLNIGAIPAFDTLLFFFQVSAHIILLSESDCIGPSTVYSGS